jgi:uncharacterized protein (DUF2249 family)
MADQQELDVRSWRKPDKHPAIFATYRSLPAGESFVLVNDHDPQHLRDEFETEYGGSYGWEYLAREPRNWRIKITKLASTALPRILVSTADLATDSGEAALTGAVWTLPFRERDLDANIIALPPGEMIAGHAGPDLDVLIFVLDGSGQLATERDVLGLEPGALAWLPRRSWRQFNAGPGGLRYLTVHQRRQALVLDTRGAPSGVTGAGARS